MFGVAPGQPRPRPDAPFGTGRGRTTGASAALAAGLALWLAAAAGVDVGRVGVVLDDGIYLVAARSLADGGGYALPSRPGSPPPKYPIGLPAAIALGLGLAPGSPSTARDFAIGRAVVLASGLAYFLLAHRWLRRVGVAPWPATLAVLAAAFHHVALVGCASTIFSDLPFAAVVFALMCRWAGRPEGADPAPAGAWGRSAVDGALAGFGYMLRGNGLTLLAGAAAAAWLGPRRRAGLAGVLVGAALVIVPLKALAAGPERAVPSGDYRLELRAGWSSPEAGARIVATNLASVALEFPFRVLAPNAFYTAALVRWLGDHPPAARGAALAASAAVGIGLAVLWRQTRRRDLPAWLHAAGTVAIFAVWPWNSILDRFLLALMPAVLLAWSTGLARMARALGASRPARRRLATLALALAAAGSLSVAARAVALFHADGRQWRGASDRASLDAALAYLAEEIEADAVVAAMWPEAVYLATGRQAVPLVEDDDVVAGRFGRVDRLALWRAEVPGRPFYLLVRSEEEDPRRGDLRLAEAVAADPALAVREAFRTPDGRFRVVAVAPR